MKSRIVLFAFCVALLSSCGNKGNDTGKVPEYAVQELQKTTANLTTAYPATIKGKQDVEIRPQVSGFITKLCVDEGELSVKDKCRSLLIRLNTKQLYALPKQQWLQQKQQ